MTATPDDGEEIPNCVLPTGFNDELLPYRLSLDDIKDNRELGNGGFGDVWLVTYRGMQLLASKRIRQREMTIPIMTDFIREISLSARLNHPHIIKFVGVAWSVEANLQALFEYAEQGDLRTWLAETDPEPWNATKIGIACDIIDALEYVHSLQPALVHRDLKSRNVLLFDSMRAKLCDFGVSRFQSTQATMTAGVGTLLWIAPEVISGNQSYNEKADIYSFGVVISELDTHELPYQELKSDTGEKLPEVAVIHRVGLGHLSPSFSPTCPSPILRLATQCLSFNPLNRPSAAEVADTLRHLRSSYLNRDPAPDAAQARDWRFV
ncbi:TPA: hypothetical protein N0F65_012699 [Lagenidium giganteum]|uniref:Protein kinase domain-containing protein n=1 Tax=Lagenidium giganteum TaxID=4803 RepID=A0AAV2YGJ0_9STRA|nr:TPA: hypothetical protein N0F65_012699 [Lagenidium giganteum]